MVGLCVTSLRSTSEPLLLGIKRLEGRLYRRLRRSDARTVLLDGELHVVNFDPNLIFQLLHVHLRLA